MMFHGDLDPIRFTSVIHQFVDIFVIISKDSKSLTELTLSFLRFADISRFRLF